LEDALTYLPLDSCSHTEGGVSYNQGQTTRIQCTVLPIFIGLPLTIILHTKKCGHSWKYPYIEFI